MTIQDALTHALPHMPDRAIAHMDAQLLLAYALGTTRAHVLAYRERVLTPEEITRFEAVLARRAAGEPYAYIVGEQAFYDGALHVSPAVLIPRPETEHLIEEALRAAQSYIHPVIADIGTGSGTIAVTLARHLPHARVLATDISPQALAIASQNGEGLAVAWHLGDLATPLIAQGERVHVLCANLPYIPSADVPELDVSRYEPVLALDGGADGLRLIERLLAQVPHVCHAGATLLLEIGAGQGQAVLALARALPLAEAHVLHDYAGHERVVKLLLR